MKFRSKVMQGQLSKLCLVAVATLVAGCAGSVCERGRTWWDRERGVCVPCARCDPTRHLAVRVPCELHRDTVCQSIYELNIWPFHARSSNDTKHTQHQSLSSPEQMSQYYDDYEVDYEVIGSGSDIVKWDIQTLTFIVAASGCVVFFVVVLSLTLHHSKQWKKLKHVLQSDVQDLSAKLKLMESGAEPVAEAMRPTDQHIYCNIHVSKDVLLASAANKQGFGNVYTEE